MTSETLAGPATGTLTRDPDNGLLTGTATTGHPERRFVCTTICITAAFVSAGTRDKSSSLRSFF